MNTDAKTSEKTIIKSFPFSLEDSEKIERGERSARIYQEMVDIKETAKSEAAATRETLKTMEHQISNLSQIVSTGVEWRDVACEERFYYASGEVCVVRTDTGEQVEVRPMTGAERQMKLDLENKGRQS